MFPKKEGRVISKEKRDVSPSQGRVISKEKLDVSKAQKRTSHLKAKA
jgi:hypothetical protein